jgi:hypothetical protein
MGRRWADTYLENLEYADHRLLPEMLLVNLRWHFPSRRTFTHLANQGAIGAKCLLNLVDITEFVGLTALRRFAWTDHRRRHIAETRHER